MLRGSAIWIGVVAMQFGTALPGQGVTGVWQGMLKVGAQELRVVLAVGKSAEGNLNATFSSIDQSPDWGARMPVDSISLQGPNLKFAVTALRGSYEGQLSADGASVEGTWSQRLALPLESGEQPRKQHGKIRRRTQYGP